MTGRPADPGLDADLAMLRDYLDTDEYATEEWRAADAALDRVEAELARLREERHEVGRDAIHYKALLFEQYAATEAAEARCARLQQALEAIANDDTPAFRNEMGQWAERWERHEKVAREALAGPDTPADSQPVYCAGCGFEDCTCPYDADSQSEEPT